MDDGALIVGGQAVNLWAERYYRKTPELVGFGPLTSKDLDYFGSRQAAQKLSDALGGVIKFPTMDDATPASAVVEAEVDGRWIVVDFLQYVIGTKPKRLAANAVELAIPLPPEQGEGEISLPVMHPLDCYQSRIANAAILKRTGDHPMRQLNASYFVLRSYIDEMLDGDKDDIREGQRTLQALFRFIRGDFSGRQAHELSPYDPIDILGYFIDDPRLDERFREFNINAMRAELLRRRRPAPLPPLV